MILATAADRARAAAPDASPATTAATAAPSSTHKARRHSAAVLITADMHALVSASSF